MPLAMSRLTVAATTNARRVITGSPRPPAAAAIAGRGFLRASGQGERRSGAGKRAQHLASVHPRSGLRRVSARPANVAAKPVINLFFDRIALLLRVRHGGSAFDAATLGKRR